MAFPALVTPLPAMDRIHGLSLYRAPVLLLRRHVLTLPAKSLGEEVQDTYKRRGQGFGEGDRSLEIAIWRIAIVSHLELF